MGTRSLSILMALMVSLSSIKFKTWRFEKKYNIYRLPPSMVAQLHLENKARIGFENTSNTFDF